MLYLGGAPGVPPAKVVILGGGVAGKHAAEMAIGHRADVTLFDISAPRLEELDDQFDGRLKTAFSTPDAVRAAVIEADLVIGCVLVHGARRASSWSRRADLEGDETRRGCGGRGDRPGRLFRDQPPHHPRRSDLCGRRRLIHYCVANMPGAAPLTSTYALGAATAPYLLALANKGVGQAFADDPGFAAGLNVKARPHHPEAVRRPPPG